MIVVPFRNNDGEIFGAYQAINKMTEEQVFSEKDLEYITLAASYSGSRLNLCSCIAKSKKRKKKLYLRWAKSVKSAPKKPEIMSNG